MKFKKIAGLTPLILIFFAGLAYCQCKVTPVANATLLGGQYWVSNSAPTSIGINMDLFISPVMNFTPKFAILPIYSANYNSTKDVRELVGGGTLTQEIQDHSLALKFVGKLSDEWKVKFRTGYKVEYLKETKDEKWGKGLFDYNKAIAGLEFERLWEKTNARAGFDYYTMHYPNYQSLVTQQQFQTSLDTTTFSEISEQAGKDVLDYNALALFFEIKRKLSDKVNGLAHYDLAIKNFKDERIVQNTGKFSSDLRKDNVHYLTFGAALNTPRVNLGITDAFQYYDSNQNSFDAANSKFDKNFYDFYQNSIIPSLLFSLGTGEKPVKLCFSWDISVRQYMERLSQSADASYNDDKIYQVVNTMGVTVDYPVYKSFSVRFSTNYRDSASNMKYEKNYKYNYYTFNYFAGINWEL